jgi:hypothetical protein
MTVLAIFKYEVKPGRFDDFLAKLQAAADPRFNSPVMPHSVRLFSPHGSRSGYWPGDPGNRVSRYGRVWSAHGLRKRQSGVEGTIRGAAGFTRDIAVCRVADKLWADFVIAPLSIPAPSGRSNAARLAVAVGCTPSRRVTPAARSSRDM